MNLFRSEDHARKWSGFNAETAAGIITLDQLVEIMSTPRHRDRLSGHYVSSAPTYAPLFFERLRQVTGGLPFWDPTAT